MNAEGIEIRFNGELCTVRSATVADLLAEFNLFGKKLAIERNKEIVPRSAYAETPVSPGDSIEIVHFVGGG